MARKLKMYSARRTGSNYLQSLLEMNFDDVQVFVHRPIWKHTYFTAFDPMDGYVIPTRHPHAWLVSVTRYFMRNEVLEKPHPRLLAERWVNLHQSYVNASERDDVAIVRYEDLIQDKKGVLGQIGDYFGLERSELFFQDKPLKRVPNGMDYRRANYDAASVDNKAYYAGGGFYEDLPLEDFYQFNQQLDYIKHLAPWEDLGYLILKRDEIDLLLNGEKAPPVFRALDHA